MQWLNSENSLKSGNGVDIELQKIISLEVRLIIPSDAKVPLSKPSRNEFSFRYRLSVFTNECYRFVWRCSKTKKTITAIQSKTVR